MAVSGLLWQGNAGKLLDAAQAGSLTLYASAPLLDEVRGVLGREKLAKHTDEETLPPLLPLDGFSVTKWNLPSMARKIQMHTTGTFPVGPSSLPSTR